MLGTGREEKIGTGYAEKRNSFKRQHLRFLCLSVHPRVHSLVAAQQFTLRLSADGCGIQADFSPSGSTQMYAERPQGELPQGGKRERPGPNTGQSKRGCVCLEILFSNSLEISPQICYYLSCESTREAQMFSQGEHGGVKCQKKASILW